MSRDERRAEIASAYDVPADQVDTVDPEARDLIEPHCPLYEELTDVVHAQMAALGVDADWPDAGIVVDAVRAQLRPHIHQAVERAINSAYGTDDRHALLGKTVAEQICDDKPWPWSVSAQFRPGRVVSTPDLPLLTEKPDENLPIGTPVLAWPGTRDDEPLVTRTRTAVWELGHGDKVVAVEGHAGGIALTHIEVLPKVIAVLWGLA